MRNDDMSIENKDYGFILKIIDTAMNIPGVKVDREEFLRKELRGKISQETIETAIRYGTKKAGISKEMAEKLARNVINSKLWITTTISAATGIPGGAAGIVGGVSVDIAQFYGNFFNLTQKLMYIYGYNDISELDSAQTDIMVAMLATACGVETAQKTIIKELPNIIEKISAGILSREAAKSLLKKISDKILITIGKKTIPLITKESIVKILGKSVPLIGGGISASFTFITFKPMANKLNDALKQSYEYNPDSEYSIIY